MSVLVIGASSQIGRFLLPRLEAAGHTWLGLSRTPPPDDARWLSGRVPDMMPPLPPVKAILSTGPLDLLAQWLSHTRLEGTPHIIATSSMSAESKRDSDVPYERELAARLRNAETALSATCASRGMPWTLFRPTLVYGAGMDRSITPIVHAAIRRHIFPLPAGRGLRQPVHADDIAAAFVAALAMPQARGKTFDMGGGERLTAAAMFRRARRSAGVLTIPAPVPRFVLELASALRPQLRGALRRLDEDLTADNTALEALLGIQARPFRPEPATWRPLGDVNASS
ncbi:NAD-dependent epimerase/dehydratase family protein [Luteibacter aegosomaticola]|uniref:SDR family oxidoreductase n=1 Tax=Luteibacter aegosomaticola TaxID=2911538 RepID=UPI001FF9AD0F|nr:NAD-dependent epimerase/dehydratase family protein [Luteibacter aegosomaticola]UPG92045.1 NAD-dependent epimerase/dehydratase family protein [Luteibacter aegosomaticola]